jgi:subtilisin family serine protease
MNRSLFRPATLLVLGAVLAAVPALAAIAQAAEDKRIPVRTVDDLPRRTYKVQGKALAILSDDKVFMPLLEQIVEDTEEDLEKYRIEDVSTLQSKYDLLSTAASIRGDFKKAIEWSDKSKALETKQAEKLMRGLTLHSRVAALEASKGDSARFAEAFKQELRQRVAALPYETIKDQIINVRAQSKMVTRALVEGSLAAQLDPMLEANRDSVPAGIVATLVTSRATLDYGLRLLPLMAEVYGSIIDAQASAAPATDLWTPRLVTLEPTAKATPVVVGVWDSGVDVAQFPGQLWTNPGETANGKDDDGNGFVDDLHGIAFEEEHDPTTGTLAKLEGLKGERDQLLSFVSASQDMQAGIQSPEVDAFQAHVRSLEGDKVKTFIEDIGLIGNYVHGTHVAGVAVAGNPFARIVHVTENFPFKSIPDKAPSVEEYRAWGRSSQQAVDAFKGAGARVVNMSWRIPRAAVEAMLAAKGAGGSKEERAELSRRIFAEFRNGLEGAIRSAPDILFIAGSGNEDNDIDFSEYVPAGLRLPNLITVGAIDHADQPAAFTSFGKNVELYANGYRIESVVPGGRKVKLSGTSMAAPQVANLALKILALKPQLKPAEVVALIKANADPLPGQPGRLIINPKKTVAALGAGT